MENRARDGAKKHHEYQLGHQPTNQQTMTMMMMQDTTTTPTTQEDWKAKAEQYRAMLHEALKVLQGFVLFAEVHEKDTQPLGAQPEA